MKITNPLCSVFLVFATVLILFSWSSSSLALAPADIRSGIRVVQGETFDDYAAPSSKLVVLCKQPCSVNAPLIKSYVVGFEAAKQEVIKFMGFDVVPQFAEVQMHLSESTVCPSNGSAAGYATGDFQSTPFVKLCLFEEVRHATNLANGHPGRFTQTVPTVDHYVLALHEYLHGMMFERMRYSFEWIAYWVSWHVGSPNDVRADLCHFSWDWSMTKLGHELCKQLGLGPAEFKQVMRALEARYQRDDGFLYQGVMTKHKTSMADFRREVDGVLGTSSAAVFNQHWSSFVTESGAEFEFGGPDYQQSGDGAIQLNGLQQPRPHGGHTHFQIDGPTGTGGFITPGFFSNLFAIAAKGQDSYTSYTPIAFNGTVDLRLDVPTAFPIDALTQEWTLMHLLNDANGMRWRYIPGTQLTTAGNQIAASITESGHYAVGPRFAVPSGLYVDEAYPDVLFHYSGDDKTVDLTIYKLEPYGAVAEADGSADLGNVPYSSEQFSNIILREQGRRKGTYWFNKAAIKSNFVYVNNAARRGYQVWASLKNTQLFGNQSVSLVLNPVKAWHHLKKRRLQPRYTFLNSRASMRLHANTDETLLALITMQGEQGTRLVVAQLEPQQSRARLHTLDPKCGLNCLDEAEVVGQVWFNDWWHDDFRFARVEAEIAGETFYHESELGSNAATEH